MPVAGEPLSQDDMINITSCDFKEFGDYMSKQYGSTQFEKGFSIVKQNQDLIYMDQGEEQLVQLLRALFHTEDTIRGFINFCTTYLIV